MNVTNSNQSVKKQKGRTKGRKGDSFHGLPVMTVLAVIAVMILTASRIAVRIWNEQISSASEIASQETPTEDVQVTENVLPSGIAGVVNGMNEVPAIGMRVKRIGTSCENVMVGQRVKTVERKEVEINVRDNMENTVNNLDSRAAQMASTPKMMSDGDYDTLLRIVEAEAGTEDIKGRVLIANVIMNRVKNEGFPNTITEVVWEYDNGVPQFSPTYDGSIHTVTVSDETKKAVRMAMEGTDYSEGALFFIQKSAAEKQNVEWFERDLKKLFKHGCHEFYTYPELADDGSEETDKMKDNINHDSNITNTIQVVKN